MVDLAILGLLKERELHGYELKKELGAVLGQFWAVSFGSLYPALERLEKTGAVEKALPKGVVRRKRNSYHLTDEGGRLFESLLEDEAQELDIDKFGLRLAFFKYLNPEVRVQLLERYRAHLQEKLLRVRSSIRAYRERIDAYTRSLMQHGADTTARDIEWIDSLLAEERANTKTETADEVPTQLPTQEVKS